MTTVLKKLLYSFLYKLVTGRNYWRQGFGLQEQLEKPSNLARDIYLDGDVYSDLKNKVTIALMAIDLEKPEDVKQHLYDLNNIIEHYTNEGAITSAFQKPNNFLACHRSVERKKDEKV